MKFRTLALAAAIASVGLSSATFSTAAQAQAQEQFFPVLVYRTGAYAANRSINRSLGGNLAWRGLGGARIELDAAAAADDDHVGVLGHVDQRRLRLAGDDLPHHRELPVLGGPFGDRRGVRQAFHHPVEPTEEPDVLCDLERLGLALGLRPLRPVADHQQGGRHRPADPREDGRWGPAGCRPGRG